MEALRQLSQTLRSRPLPTDGILAGALALLVVGESTSTGVTTPVELALPVGLAMTVPLAARRRWPLPAAAIVAAAFAALGLLDDSELPPQSTLLALAVAAWSVAAYAPRRVAWLGLVLVLGAIAVNAVDDLIVLAPLNAGVWAVGRLLRDRQERALALEQRAAALERERAETARVATAEERARIARELHDVVAHHVSVVVMQAGAERLALGDERPETGAALRVIERAGREALVDLRRLLGVLRRDDDDEGVALAPQPSLDLLESLVERVRDAGLPVELEVVGEREPLPPGVDISAYRIVQEALTNVLKHAGPARAHVCVCFGGDDLEIQVADDGRGPAGDGKGHGLTGMRERATIFGGELHAGPRSGGGYLVRTRLPRREAQP